jgi:hypothetical protein
VWHAYFLLPVFLTLLTKWLSTSLTVFRLWKISIFEHSHVNVYCHKGKNLTTYLEVTNVYDVLFSNT